MAVKKLSLQSIIGGGYNDFWTTTARYRVVKGSRASKKSKTAAINRIVRLLEYPESNYLCIRRYANTIRDSIFSDCKWAINRLGLEGYFSYTVSPFEVTYIPTGQKILFRGLDEGTKVTSISVPKGVLNFVDIEEAYEISESDFDKVDLSIRGEVPKGYFKQLTLLFNPWSANSWLKARFFDNPDENTFIKTTTYECNEWLDDADRRVLELMRQNNTRRYAIEGQGEWGISEGLVYENWEVQNFEVEELRKTTAAAFGLDFGFTDPTAFVAMLIDKANYVIYVFDEWYKTGVTNKDIAEQLIKIGYGGQRIICDSAEPKSIQELVDNGISHAEGSRKGRDSVSHGIQLIQNYKIIIKPHCKEFIKEISNYCWGKDSYNGGIGWLYPYYDENGQFKFKKFHPWEVLPFWKDEEHTELDFAVRIYDELGYKGTEEVIYTFVEVYDTNGIHRFEYDRASCILTPDYQTYYFELPTDGEIIPYNWNRVPLIAFKANSHELPLIRRCKSLQDGINDVMSSFADGMQENASGNTILVIKNYDGENLGEFRYNLSQYKAVKVRTIDGADGGLDSLQIEVNCENYKTILEELKKALVRNCRGYDAEDLKSSGSPNEMTIKSVYSDIDLDANELETEYQAAFEELLWFVNQHLINTGAGNFTDEPVEIIFNRDMMVNESQIITDLNASSGILSHRTLVANHPYINDVDAEMEQIKNEAEDSINQYQGAFGSDLVFPKISDADEADNDDDE